MAFPTHKIVNGEVVELSPEEIDNITAEWNQDDLVKQANLYKECRRNAYPALGDQLDMLWHAMNTNEIPKAAEFYNAIKAVKDTYPKA